ncbi:MAG: histidine phosphotransferase family protein [Pseudorhodobacter sp.]
MSDRPDLTALLGSRICHDLISPIGAIGNGVELLMMEGGSTTGPEIALISESVASANARIRFFRVAFGQSSPDQRIGRSEILSILADLAPGSRLSIDWQIAQDMTRQDAKLGFLAFLCLETAMAYGGKVTLTSEGNRLTVIGQAARMKIVPEVWELLSSPGRGEVLTPALVHFALLGEEITRQRRRIAVELRETEIRMVI